MTNDKIVEIETALSHHDRQIQELSEIASAQWKEIEALKRRLSEALSRIAQTEGSGLPASAKPPHY